MQNLKPSTVGVPMVCRQLVFSVMILFVISVLSLGANAQTYTSNFPSSAGNYSSVSPSGVGCLSPAIAQPQNVADADLTNYANVTGLLSVALTCSSPTYSIRSKLNFPVGTTSAPAGFSAGFRVNFISAVSLALLQSNMTIRTYLAGNLRETVPGTNIANLSILSSGPTDIYFVSTASFDEVELVFNNSIVPLSVAFDYRIYHAFGTISVLPVGFGGVSAKIQAGRLNVDWKTVSESNNDHFVVQASYDGKTWTGLGNVATKAQGGQSSVDIAYSFSTPWGSTVLAGFGLLGLLLLPATKNRLLRVAMVLLLMAAVISCAKDKDGFNQLEKDGASSRPVYVRVAQVDKDGTTSHSEVVLAKR